MPRTLASLSLLLLVGLAVPDAHAQAPMPIVITPSLSASAATAHRDRNGHFIFDTEVNGVPLSMMFDTGATLTTLRAEDAGKVGIDPNALTYSTIVSTGNGRTAAAIVTLGTLTVGAITRHNVQALVAQPGNLGVNLLGQSFMAKIGGYRLVGQDLVLQGEP